jgi:hypothetical protein
MQMFPSIIHIDIDVVTYETVVKKEGVNDSAIFVNPETTAGLDPGTNWPLPGLQ